MERLTRLIVVQGGTVYREVSGALQAVSGGTDALDPDVRVAAAEAFGNLYFADGTNYKVYNGFTNTVSDWTATAGSMPVDSNGNTGRLLALYRGRMVVSGIKGDGHNWFASAQDNPRDFDYEPDTVTEAVAVAGNNSVVGLTGDLITALVPLNDDVLVFGGDHTIYQMTGDPAAGGRVDLVTDVTGMAWDAWCKDPVGAIWFFGNQGGVYRYVPGQQVELKSRAIENRLNEVNTATNIISLVWNDREKGVHLFITPTEVGSTIHYFYDLRNDAWFEDAFGDNDINPTAVYLCDGDSPDDRHVLLGGHDGHVREWDIDADDDDGTAIDSYVWLGPFQAENSQAILTEIRAILADGSDDVTLDVFVGDSPEEALASTSKITRTLSAGRNRSIRDRARGHAIFVRLRNNTLNQSWALERIQAMFKPLGPGSSRIFS